MLLPVCAWVCVSLSSVYLLHFDFAITCCSCCFCNGGAYPAANGSRRLQFSCFLFYYFLLPLHTRTNNNRNRHTHMHTHAHVYPHTLQQQTALSESSVDVGVAVVASSADSIAWEFYFSCVFLFYFLCFVVVAVAAAVDLIYWQHCCGRATVAPAENESVLVCMCKRNNVSVCMYVMQIVCPASAKQQWKRKTKQINKTQNWPIKSHSNFVFLFFLSREIKEISFF